MMRNVMIDCVETGPLSVNTYIAYIKGGESCIVIDPADAYAVCEYAKDRGLKIAAVLLTHCHFDHILGVPELQRNGARLYIGEKDAAGLNDRSVSLCFKKLDEMIPDVLVKDGDIIEEAELSLKVLDTPGHTAGGVCYVLEESKAILAGDTIFCGSVGRTDLSGGDMGTLIASIRNKLFAMEGDYILLPGHGNATSLEYERQHNPYAGRGARW